jgi:hypothetical protein
VLIPATGPITDFGKQNFFEHDRKTD